MTNEFKTVAVVARRQHNNIVDTVLAVEAVLEKFGVQVIFEDVTAGYLPQSTNPGASSARKVLPRRELGHAADLVVVVGGDGSLLGVSRDIADTGVPIVGVNRGGLGFLASVSPEQLEKQLGEIVTGDYIIEEHFLLQARVFRDGKCIAESTALNDVVLHSGSMAKMIEVELWIDDEYVYNQRSDGVIVASPTGSTAYALSAGGPIMHPNLDAIVIVPMFPHTLTSRPLVVPGDVELRIKVSHANDTAPQLSCDSQVHTTLQVDDEVVVTKFATRLQLCCPTGHSFYESCRSKLDWATRLGGRAPA